MGEEAPTPPTENHMTKTLDEIEKHFRDVGSEETLKRIETLKSLAESEATLRKLVRLHEEMNGPRPKPNELKHFKLTVGSGDDEHITIAFDLREKSLDKYMGMAGKVLMQMLANPETLEMFEKWGAMTRDLVEGTAEKPEDKSTFPWLKGTKVRVKVPKAELEAHPDYLADFIANGKEGVVTGARNFEAEGVIVNVDFGDRTLSIVERYLELVMEPSPSPAPESKIAHIPVTEDPGPDDIHDPPV